MAYRDLRPTDACASHSAAAAHLKCHRCTRAVCEPCAGFAGFDPICPPCRAQEQRRRQRGRQAAALLALLLSPVALFGFGRAIAASLPPPQERALRQARQFLVEGSYRSALATLDAARGHHNLPALERLALDARQLDAARADRLLTSDEIALIEEAIELGADDIAYKLLAKLRTRTGNDPLFTILQHQADKVRQGG